MVDSTASDKERHERAIEALGKLHNKTMTKLASLKKQQLDLYRRISERLDGIALKKSASQIEEENKQ